jgi:hypothetical protein
MCSSTVKDDGKDADVGHINSMQTLDSKVYIPKGPRLYVPTFDIDTHIAEAWKHWEDIGKPKFVCAPMVDQSELSFRMMVSSVSEIVHYMLLHTHAMRLDWWHATIVSFSALLPSSEYGMPDAFDVLWKKTMQSMREASASWHLCI